MTPQATQIYVTSERLKIQQCALVTLFRSPWATKWHLCQILMFIVKSNMAAGSQRFILVYWRFPCTRKSLGSIRFHSMQKKIPTATPMFSWSSFSMALLSMFFAVIQHPKSNMADGLNRKLSYLRFCHT